MEVNNNDEGNEKGNFTQGLYQLLEERGGIDRLKAHIRADLFHALEQPDFPAPTPPSSVLLMNQLVKEYLTYLGCSNTLSVFNVETGRVGEDLDKEFLEEQIGITMPEETSDLPLLLGMAQFFQNLKEKRDHYDIQEG